MDFDQSKDSVARMAVSNVKICQSPVKIPPEIIPGPIFGYFFFLTALLPTFKKQ